MFGKAEKHFQSHYHSKQDILIIEIRYLHFPIMYHNIWKITDLLKTCSDHFEIILSIAITRKLFNAKILE